VPIAVVQDYRVAMAGSKVELTLDEEVLAVRRSYGWTSTK